MPDREIVHPRMQRVVFDLLTDEERSRTPNEDGTYTISRRGRGAQPMPVHVELVDEPLLDPGRIELSPTLQHRLIRADRPNLDLPTLLSRHCGGDWGEVSDALSLANDVAALDHLRPLTSSYRLSDGTLTITTRPSRKRTQLAWSDPQRPDPSGDPEGYARSRSLVELADAVARAGDECEEPRRSLLLEAARRLIPIELDTRAFEMPDAPVEIDLTNADWWRDGAEDLPGGVDAQIRTTMIIGGVSFHVLGLQLAEGAGGAQYARQRDDDFALIYDALGGDGPWQTVEWEGRDYGLIITPHCR